MMKKRSLKIGDYDTATHGWTLTGYKLSDPEQKINYVEKTHGDGAWDLSTVLTAGVPRYKNRSLTATLECSEGTREDREKSINELVNTYDGLEWPIVIPDRPDHYLTGRVHIAVDYSDLAHAAITITATCSPWLFQARETIVELAAQTAVQTYIFRNGGRRTVVPVITSTGDVSLIYGANSTQIGAGVHEWSALLLTPGLHPVEYSGSGKITVTYREAVLR